MLHQLEWSVCAAELLRCADGKKSRLRGEMDNSRTGLGVVQATPIATTPIQDLPFIPREFFCRPAEEVALELVGCLLVKRKWHP